MRQRGSLREFAGICKFKIKLFVDTGSRFPEKSGNLNFDIFIAAYSYFLKKKCNKKTKQTAAKLREPQISVRGRLGIQISVSKNNFTEIYISQRLDWAFASLSNYTLLTSLNVVKGIRVFRGVVGQWVAQSIVNRCCPF